MGMNFMKHTNCMQPLIKMQQPTNYNSNSNLQCAEIKYLALEEKCASFGNLKYFEFINGMEEKYYDLR